MPDHLHWLVQLGESGTVLSKIVGRIKSVTSHALGGQLWQAGFYDRAIRAEDDLMAVARYIVANPVRAGLVSSVRLYSHWDAIYL